ncbi:MAG: hypothetical protein K6B17_05365, partial [Treponema sp.]|nr:hypothetical protein [Treponema sp.]
ERPSFSIKYRIRTFASSGISISCPHIWCSCIHPDSVKSVSLSGADQSLDQRSFALRATEQSP